MKFFDLATFLLTILSNEIKYALKIEQSRFFWYSLYLPHHCEMLKKWRSADLLDNDL